MMQLKIDGPDIQGNSTPDDTVGVAVGDDNSIWYLRDIFRASDVFQKEPVVSRTMKQGTLNAKGPKLKS